MSGPGVELYWLPLGSGQGGGCVRTSGSLYETVSAWRDRRARLDLFHTGLVVRVDGSAHAIEMTPVWASTDPGRGVVGEGPVGVPALGRWRLFRYEVRCWRDGRIPDAAAAVDSPRLVSADELTARKVLAVVADFPRVTWGRDELRAGEMWNSNSLVSWLLVRSGHDVSGAAFRPPRGGRAPGWTAGVAVAARPPAGPPPGVSPPCRRPCPP
ncbi:hypothetical protein [Pedococcus bigeumensis]|uniref:hypothetical protein n=1 Tax=Pedococcus bigeumensis TaxID=433644 RepID=UPI002FEA7549